MKKVPNKIFTLIFVLTILVLVFTMGSKPNVQPLASLSQNIPTNIELTYQGAEYTMADLADLVPWYEAGMQLSCVKTICNASETPYILVVKGDGMETQMVEVVVKKKILTVTLTAGGWTVGETPVVPTAMGLTGVCAGDENKVILNTIYYDANNNVVEDITKVGAGTYTMHVTLHGSAVDNYEFQGAIGKTFVVSEKPVADKTDEKVEDDPTVAWILWGVIGGVVITAISVLMIIIIKHCCSIRKFVQ